MKYLISYINEIIALFNEMSPYLLIGFLFSGLLHVYFPLAKVRKFLGENNLTSVINAALLGIPLPLCSCGVIPTGVSFYKDGASKGSSISFLISTPQTGIDSILVTYSLLGLPFAIIRPIIAFITGIIGGIITNSTNKNECHNDEFACDSCSTEKKVFKNKFYSMIHYAFIEFLQDIAKWLIIGILLAGLISVIVPDDFFTSYISNDYLGMLILLVASIPLYVCATASVPIAAILLLKGLSPGAAIVFLMAGPATNIATMTVIGKVFGKKALLSYLFSIIGGALFFGIIINEFVPREFFVSSIDFINHSAHENHILPLWLKSASSIILVLLLINGYIRKIIQGRKKPIPPDSALHENIVEKSYIVKGMSCNHCKNNIEKRLKEINTIKTVNVKLSDSTVNIIGSYVDDSVIKKTIEGLGYKVI